MARAVERATKRTGMPPCSAMKRARDTASVRRLRQRHRGGEREKGRVNGRPDVAVMDIEDDPSPIYQNCGDGTKPSITEKLRHTLVANAEPMLSSNSITTPV